MYKNQYCGGVEDSHYSQKRKGKEEGLFNNPLFMDYVQSLPGKKAMENVELFLKRLGNKETYHKIDNGECYVGRDLNAFIACTSPYVSRRHMCIIKKSKESTILIKDLNTANGTFINKRRLQPNSLYKVVENDVITLGSLNDIPVENIYSFQLVKNPIRQNCVTEQNDTVIVIEDSDEDVKINVSDLVPPLCDELTTIKESNLVQASNMFDDSGIDKTIDNNNITEPRSLILSVNNNINEPPTLDAIDTDCSKPANTIDAKKPNDNKNSYLHITNEDLCNNVKPDPKLSATLRKEKPINRNIVDSNPVNDENLQNSSINEMNTNGLTMSTSLEPLNNSKNLCSTKSNNTNICYLNSNSNNIDHESINIDCRPINSKVNTITNLLDNNLININVSHDKTSNVTVNVSELHVVQKSVEIDCSGHIAINKITNDSVLENRKTNKTHSDNKDNVLKPKTSESMNKTQSDGENMKTHSVTLERNVITNTTNDVHRSNESTKNDTKLSEDVPKPEPVVLIKSIDVASIPTHVSKSPKRNKDADSIFDELELMFLSQTNSITTNVFNSVVPDNQQSKENLNVSSDKQVSKDLNTSNTKIKDRAEGKRISSKIREKSLDFGDGSPKTSAAKEKLPGGEVMEWSNSDIDKMSIDSSSGVTSLQSNSGHSKICNRKTILIPIMDVNPNKRKLSIGNITSVSKKKSLVNVGEENKSEKCELNTSKSKSSDKHSKSKSKPTSHLKSKSDTHVQHIKAKSPESNVKCKDKSKSQKEDKLTSQKKKKSLIDSGSNKLKSEKSDAKSKCPSSSEKKIHKSPKETTNNNKHDSNTSDGVVGSRLIDIFTRKKSRSISDEKRKLENIDIVSNKTNHKPKFKEDISAKINKVLETNKNKYKVNDSGRSKAKGSEESSLWNKLKAGTSRTSLLKNNIVTEHIRSIDESAGHSKDKINARTVKEISVTKNNESELSATKDKCVATYDDRKSVRKSYHQNCVEDVSGDSNSNIKVRCSARISKRLSSTPLEDETDANKKTKPTVTDSAIHDTMINKLKSASDSDTNLNKRRSIMEDLYSDSQENVITRRHSRSASSKIPISASSKIIARRKSVSFVLDNEIPKMPERRASSAGLKSILKPTRSSDLSCIPSWMENFLYTILRWNPVWLEEHHCHKKNNKDNSLPPLFLNKKDSVPTLTYHFNNFEQYVKTFTNIILLEVWEQVYNSAYLSGRFLGEKEMINLQIVSVASTPGTSMITKVSCKFSSDLVDNTKKQFSHGVLLLVKFVNATKGEFFGLVDDFDTKVNRFTSKDPAISFYVKLDQNTNERIRNGMHVSVRVISSVRNEIMLIRSMHLVESSQLMKIILSPKELHFTKFKSTVSLQWKHELNLSQKKAVQQCICAISSCLPSIQLIHGPPGTGKSRVIAALVLEYFQRNVKNRSNRGKVLICSPTNIAVDEIIKRLLDAKREKAPKLFEMVRVGRYENMQPWAQDISTIKLAQKFNHTPEMQNQIKILTDQIEKFKSKMDADTPGGAYNKIQYNIYKKKLDDLMFSSSEGSSNLHKEEAEVLRRADVIVSTLQGCSFSKMNLLNNKIAFCVVDEAAKAVEPEVLIPLSLGVECLVLVGDNRQLPGYTHSQHSKDKGFSESMFTRLLQSMTSWKENPSHMLDIQYRMAPAIAHFPNEAFYDGSLENGTTYPPLPQLIPEYRVVHISGVDSGQGESGANIHEAKIVARIATAIQYVIRKEKINLSLCILTPYSAHRDALQTQLKILSSNNIDVHTVDSFQGQERDVVIVSLARSAGAGFLFDPGRMTVLLTRARRSTIVCCNPEFVKGHALWESFLNDAKKRNMERKLPKNICKAHFDTTPRSLESLLQYIL